MTDAAARRWSAVLPALLMALWMVAVRAADTPPSGPEAATAAPDLEALRAEYVRARGEARWQAGQAYLNGLVGAADAALDARAFDEAAGLYRQAVALASTVAPAEEGRLRTQLQLAGARQSAHDRVASLRQDLEAAPEDAEARERLIRTLLLELDDPAAAAEALPPGEDSRRSKLILVAGMSLARLPDRACLELAKWYLEMAPQASPGARWAVFQRVEAYLARYLGRQQARDAEWVALWRTLAQVRRMLAERESWRDVLVRIDVDRHCVPYQRQCRREGKALVLDASRRSAWVTLPLVPTAGYEADVTVRTAPGHGRVHLEMPVAGRTVRVTARSPAMTRRELAPYELEYRRQAAGGGRYAAAAALLGALDRYAADATADGRHRDAMWAYARGVEVSREAMAYREATYQRRLADARRRLAEEGSPRDEPKVDPNAKVWPVTLGDLPPGKAVQMELRAEVAFGYVRVTATLTGKARVLYEGPVAEEPGGTGHCRLGVERLSAVVERLQMRPLSGRLVEALPAGS